MMNGFEVLFWAACGMAGGIGGILLSLLLWAFIPAGGWLLVPPVLCGAVAFFSAVIWIE